MSIHELGLRGTRVPTANRRFPSVSGTVVLALLIVGALATPSSAPSPESKAPRPGGTVPAPSPNLTKTATAQPSPFLRREGSTFVLNGKLFRFVGVNSFSMATHWGQNLGCGGPVDADALFAALPRPAVVRMWAWQGSFATNPGTRTRDWRPLDRIVRAAERHGALLIVSLTSQAGECDDGHWKDPAWYMGGYREHWNDNGYAITINSFWDYIHEIVPRYASSPAIAMWELVNEPEASDCPGEHAREYWCGGHRQCPNQNLAAYALRRFFDVVGREIKSMDPNHLIGSGVLGGGQCGMAGTLYSYIHQSSWIDVTSYHDYAQREPMPVDHWNELQSRIDQSRALGKPIIVGESGIEAADGQPDCPSRQQRSGHFRRKLDRMFPAGINGFLAWNTAYTPAHSQCDFDIPKDDPAFSLFREYRIPATR